MALYSNEPIQASVSAEIWVAVLGFVFGYFCLLIGKSCQISKSGTYRECWGRTIGSRGGLWVAIANTLDPLLGILTNAAIIGQSLQLILESIDIETTVQESLILCTILFLAPLCLLKHLGALAPFAATGMLAVLLTFACMLFRYLDGSYRPGGQFYDRLFGTETQPLSLRAMPFVAVVFTSFDCHYDSPPFYVELPNASVSGYAKVVGYAFGTIVGFLTFGGNENPFILDNYSPKDSLATVCRAAMGFRSLITYPLNFVGVRDNTLDILGISDEIGSEMKLKVFSLLLLVIITILCCSFTDLGLINAIGGGTTVALVCFVFPAIMYWETMRKFSTDGPWERRLVLILMVAVVVLGILGVWMSVKYSEDKNF